jgi:hypothetical protein
LPESPAPAEAKPLIDGQREAVKRRDGTFEQKSRSRFQSKLDDLA